MKDGTTCMCACDCDSDYLLDWVELGKYLTILCADCCWQPKECMQVATNTYGRALQAHFHLTAITKRHKERIRRKQAQELLEKEEAVRGKSSPAGLPWDREHLSDLRGNSGS